MRTEEARPLEDLLGATARRDPAAFRALYDATSPKLFAVILRIIGNRGLAEEVLQEAYVKVWQNAAKYSPAAGRPAVWLAAVARNAAIDRIRSERIARASGPDDEAVLARIAAPGAVDIGEREALRRCLSTLDARYVAVVDSGGREPALIAEVDTGTGLIRVRTLGAETPAGHSLELWHVAEGHEPRSLGILEAGLDAQTIEGAPTAGPVNGMIAVSIEPEGGSPTGSPTGPIVYTGRLIAVEE